MRDKTYLAECQLIGCCLLSPTAHLEIDVKVADFEDQWLSGVWEYMQKQDSIDVVEMISHFDERALTDLLSHVPSSSDAKKWAKSVKANAHRRRLANVLTEAANRLRISDDSVDELSGMIMNSIETQPGTVEAEGLPSVLLDCYRDLEAAHTSGQNINFIPTGLRDFDLVFGGMQKEGLIIIAGRPSMGKTAFATKIARNTGERLPTLVISMEMSKKQLAMRYMAAEMGIDLQEMMQGRLSSEIWRKLAASVEALAESKIHINDMSRRNIYDVCAEVRRFKRKHKEIGSVVIDYLGLMDMDQGNGKSKTDAVGDVTRSLKVLAGELGGAPVVLLSQLNRDLEKRANKEPVMADLRDSGSIEQDADQIIFPYRPEVYDKKPENEGLAYIIMAKNRNGKTGTVAMNWRAHAASFMDIEKQEEFL